MIRVGRKRWLALLLGWVLCLSAAVAYDVVPWRQLSDREMSPLGRVVMRGNTRSWTHAESERFIYHSASARLLPQVAHEVEWCFAEIGRWLDLDEPEQRGRVFIFNSVLEWRQVIQKSMYGRESVAASVGREIYIRRAPEDVARYVDVAHELVHFRLAQAYGAGVPLWLDEGLAEYLGWRVAADYYRRERELRLAREPHPVPEDQWLPWPEFFALQHYPEDSERNRIFYRQSYEVIRYVVEQVGESRLGEWVRQVIAANGDFDRVQMDEWDMDDMDWNQALPQAGPPR